MYVKYLASTTGHRLCAESCPTLCSLLDCSLSDSSVHGILQARIQERVACPPSADIPNTRIEPSSPVSPALAGGFLPLSHLGSCNRQLIILIFVSLAFQCSCLESPRDGGAWWAAVSQVTQSRTRLKRLSSSSSIQIGEGNGTPLQYSCLENPMDRGAW